MQADETKFRLLSDGPGLMAVKTLEQRLQRLEWSRYTTPEHISSAGCDQRERREKSDNHLRHAYRG